MYFDIIHPDYPPLSQEQFHIYIHGVCLCVGSKFCLWEKACNICLSKPGLFCLTWWSPVPSIFLQMTWHSFILLYGWIIYYINTHHIFFIHLPVDEHVGLLHSLAVEIFFFFFFGHTRVWTQGLTLGGFSITWLMPEPYLHPNLQQQLPSTEIQFKSELH
jgi:hypothetical protein